jgi:protein Tex
VLAQNIIDYRTENGAYDNIKTLIKVPRMGKKSYEQSAGFLRVVDGQHPLDNTGVHPERYSIVEAMARDQKCNIETLIKTKEIRQSINLNEYISADCGRPTLIDIMKELDKPGLDPRGAAQPIQFSDHINTIEDLSAGMILPGIVNNVTKFGAFVDIGIKESGLVHISEITNKFINDPAEILSVNQDVKVKVLSVDIEKKRVSLSIKQV